jgi:hypothetical protein
VTTPISGIFPINNTMSNETMVDSTDSNESMDNETMEGNNLPNNGSMTNGQCAHLNINGNEVERIATYLVNKLSNRNERAFRWYCYAAWHIPESVLIKHLEYAVEHGNSPAAYFTALIKKELRVSPK